MTDDIPHTGRREKEPLEMENEKGNFKDVLSMEEDSSLKEDIAADVIKSNITENSRKMGAGKRFGKKMLIAITAIAVFAVFIGIRIYNLPENRLSGLLDLGNTYLAEQNYEEAVLVFEQAIAIDARNMEAYTGGLEAYQHIDDTEGQQIFYEKALEAVRGADESFLMENMERIVAIYMQADDIYRNRAEETLTLLEEGYRTVPGSSELKDKLISVYLTTAEEYMDSGSGEESLKVYDRLLEIDEEDERIRHELKENVREYVDILMEEKKYDEIKMLKEQHAGVADAIDINVDDLEEPEVEITENNEDTIDNEADRGYPELFEYLPRSFSYSSGMGNWYDDLELNSDGTFRGQYYDMNMGEFGTGYEATVYICNYEGKFSIPEQIDKYIYSVKLEYLNILDTPGTEYYEDNIRYICTELYDLIRTDEFLIYLPGCLINNMDQEFVSWWGPVIPLDGERLSAGYYGIYNINSGTSFLGMAEVGGENSE